MEERRWQYCIDHYDDDVYTFFSSHFKDEKRKCLYIGGAGFDPRSTIIIQMLSEVLGTRLHAVLIREERPDPDKELIKRAESNVKKIQNMACYNEVIKINIFADDNAVVGGINISREIEKLDVDGYTDIVIDLSALSIGVSFPTVASMYYRVQKFDHQLNIHLTAISNPSLDALISSSSNDRVTDIRGFSIPDLLGQPQEKARLWLPLITSKKNTILNYIHADIRPHDTCPILPFPSENPKKADLLALDYITELESEWNVDPRNFVYADERNPLDIYRTILRIDSERKPVFETFGGSLIILSPIGSRIPATGMLLAALECQFPVAYVEALEYHVDWNQVDSLECNSLKKVHIWLYGEAYYKDTKGWKDEQID